MTPRNLLLCAAFSGSAMLSATLARSAPRVVAFAAPGPGQSGLGVGFDAAGALRAATCETSECSIERGVEVTFPSVLRPAIPSAQFAVVGIGLGRRAIVASVTDAKSARAWSAVLVAPLGGGAPRLIFAGFTGLSAGEEGTRRGQQVEISEADETGARRIVVGELEEDLSLCGRPTLLAPKVLASSDLELHPAKLQRLGAEERASARHVPAGREPAGAPPAGSGLLRAVAASSAVGSPDALTDGDPQTTWAENRGGAGRGEFVLLDAPPELPLTGLDLWIRPVLGQPLNGVAPKTFWLATSHALVEVSMPEDAWRYPGARYGVRLDPPLQGDCLALVSESAFDERPQARVTFAELRAKSEFDEAPVPALVAALAGGGERAQAAEAVLRVSGQPGFDAVARAFDGLDEGGRRVALDLLDQAPCQSSLTVYVSALSGASEAQRIHAREHIRRCGNAAGPYLLSAAKKAQGARQLDILGELMLADPAESVDVIALLLDTDSRERRAALRVALARASFQPEARPRLLALLSNPSASPRLLLEVLRALGARVVAFQPEAGAALMRVETPGADFGTRFLALAPSAELASFDPALRAVLEHTLTSDPEPRLRAHALAVLKNPADFAPDVRRLLSDDDVRVREAAVRASAGLPNAAPALAERLARDPWPLVRVAAADALAAATPSAATDLALARALEHDESPHARARVVLALGTHRARRELPKIRERLADADEWPMVRAASAQALAAMCDAGSLEPLTGYAQKLADPSADAGEHLLGAAALLALGELRPPDLRTRLEPLRRQSAPPQARQAAEAVLLRRGACDRSIPPRQPAKSRPATS